MTSRCDAKTRRKWPMTTAVLAVIAAMLLTYSAISVGYLWYEVYGSRASSDHDAAKIVKNLKQQWSKTPPEHKSPVVSKTPDAADVVSAPSDDGTPFAIMMVPRFGADWQQPVLQGTRLAELGVGVGHEPGTAMPGQIGNVGLAGHRTTYSRPFHDIANLRPGDLIIIMTDTTTYTYKVTSHQIVKPSAVSVFAPVPDQPGKAPTEAMLTMSSCNPEYSATQRYVVHAKLVKVVKR